MRGYRAEVYAAVVGISIRTLLDVKKCMVSLPERTCAGYVEEPWIDAVGVELVVAR